MVQQSSAATGDTGSESRRPPSPSLFESPIFRQVRQNSNFLECDLAKPISAEECLPLEKDGDENILKTTKEIIQKFIEPSFAECLLSCSISLSYFCIGLVRGFSAPAFPSMLELNPELLPNKTIESWAGSIPPLGAFFGSIIAGPLMHYIGRKYTVMVTSPLWTVSWALIATARSWEMLVLGRFLSGMGAGLTLPSAQIYVSECTDSNIRGVIGSFPALSMSAGILVAYIIGDYMPWNYVAWVSFIISVLLIVVISFLPESPVWLAGKNRHAKAKKSRDWLRLAVVAVPPTSVVVNKESEATRNSGVDQSPTSWRELMSRPILMPMLIGLTLLLIQQVSGIDAVIFFTVEIFRASGSSIDGNLATIIVGIVQLASNLLSLFVVDRAGRKPLLIVSGVVMSIAMGFMGLAFHLNASGNHSYGYIPLVSLIVFMVGFSIGFGSIPFLLMGEIFPTKQRGMLSSIAISFNVAAMFTVIKTYHSLETVLTSAGTFWMYSIFCALGVVFVVFCVPETKGRELEGMALVFRKSFRVLAGKSRTKPVQTATMNDHSGVRNEGFREDDHSGDNRVIESTKC